MIKRSNSTAALNDILYQTMKTMKAFIAMNQTLVVMTQIVKDLLLLEPSCSRFCLTLQKS